MKIDPQRSVAYLDKCVARETDPHRRAIVENYREHLVAEVSGDLERIMATLIEQPVYHFYNSSTVAGDGGPKDQTEVRAFYETQFKSRMNVLERHYDRLVVTDDCLIADGWMDHVHPGDAVIARGIEVDASGNAIEPSAYYLTSYRICAILPYTGANGDVKMVGENTYTMPNPNDLRRVGVDEIPDLLR